MAQVSTPVVNVTAWHALRRQFSRTLPSTVSEGYLATVLKLKDSPARNVLRNLKLLGLVNADNHPTDLAIRWRDDEQYAAACSEIAESTYPDELRAAVPGPDADPAAAAQWFRRSRRLGEGAAKNAARTYVLIASGKLPAEAGTSGAASTRGRGSTNGGGPARTAARPKERTGSRSNATRKRDQEQLGVVGGFEMPRPQIAVQINIAPNMTAEQIDQVFASMARHFYSEADVE